MSLILATWETEKRG